MKPTPAEILDDANKHHLNSWVAEYVMGYRWQIYPWSKGKRPQRHLACPGDQSSLGAQLARGDEPEVDAGAYRYHYLWTNDIGHAWAVIEAVKKWTEERQLRFLSALTMQNESSQHPLAWLTFSCDTPAVALCRAAVIASV